MSFWQRLRIWRLRLRSLTRPEALDRELHRELVFHFEQLVAENLEAGLSLEAAHQAAHRALGNVAVVEETCRDARRVSWAHDFSQDLKYGIRSLRRQPAMTIVAVTSLALGIGANAAVLGAFDALLVQGLPVAHADRLVAIQSAPLDNPSQPGSLSLQDYASIRDRSQSFETIGASIRWTSDLPAEGPGVPPERILGQLVTPTWFSSLGIAPEMGQVFSESTSQQDSAAPAIVISHAFWQRRFGGDPDVLHRKIQVQGSTRTIIGVMPTAFRYQDPEIDYWAPLVVSPQPDPGSRLFGVRARLKPGVSLAQAQAEVHGLAVQLALERPGQDKGWGLQVRSLNEVLFGWTREPLAIFETAAALVLLIGCANVAALLLSRASLRRREMGLRTSLGAGRARLVRQSLTESMLLAIGGGGLGLFVAVVGQRALVGMNGPPSAIPLTAIGLNLRVFGLLVLLSVLSGLACGLVPAIRDSHVNPGDALKEPGPGIGVATYKAMARGLLVSAQLALALILLVGSGLLLNSLVRLMQRDLNLDSSGLIRLDYGVQGGYTKRIGSYQGFPYFEITRPPSQTLQRVIDRLRAVPGAESAAGISAPPVDGFVLATPDVSLEPPGSAPASATYFLVTPNLFKTLRTPFLRGRDFTDDDRVDTPWVAIVNETFAHQFWGSDDPIGKRVRLDTVPEEQSREVIAVVRDIPTRHAEPPVPVIYASYLQQPSRYRAPWAGLLGQMTFMIRTSGDVTGLIQAARQAVAEVDPDRPLSNVSTVDAHMRNGLSRFRDSVLLVNVLAFVATLLAAIGTYGVMTYAVNQHTREIGIRRAMGAGSREIIAFVTRRAMIFVGVGLVAGVAGALLFTRLIASELWGITPTDPVTFASVTILLVAVAALACLIPARRALAVDPTIALRAE